MFNANMILDSIFLWIMIQKLIGAIDIIWTLSEQMYIRRLSVCRMVRAYYYNWWRLHGGLSITKYGNGVLTFLGRICLIRIEWLHQHQNLRNNLRNQKNMTDN
uniref:Putative secreted protein n=1 Tax=Panstrongylus lignarius TaxID=156445 RepID=A0A224XUH5_9HEMI